MYKRINKLLNGILTMIVLSAFLAMTATAQEVPTGCDSGCDSVFGVATFRADGTPANTFNRPVIGEQLTFKPIAIVDSNLSPYPGPKGICCNNIGGGAAFDFVTSTHSGNFEEAMVINDIPEHQVGQSTTLAEVSHTLSIDDVLLEEGVYRIRHTSFGSTYPGLMYQTSLMSTPIGVYGFGINNAVLIDYNPNSCAGDANGDGGVDVDDLIMVLNNFGTCGEGTCLADFNDDGLVNTDDLLAVITGWGLC